MKKCTKCGVTKIIEDFAKDKHKLDGMTSACKACKSLKDKDRYKDNKVEIKIRTKLWAQENKKLSSIAKARWQKAHQEKYNFWSALRRTKLLNATPKWLNLEQKQEIFEFYKKAKFISQKTGIQHDVDHIIPLQGKNVTGLHVPWNLQILTHKENNKKRHTFKVGNESV